MAPTRPRRAAVASTATASTSFATTPTRPLPSWARLRRPKTLNVQPLSLAEEEHYLRTISYQQAARTLDAVLLETLQKLGEPTLRLMEKLLVVKPGTENDEQKVGHTNCKEVAANDFNLNHDQTTEEEKEEHDDFDSYFRPIELPETYPSLLLPLLVLHAHVHLLDCYEWTRFLVETARSRWDRCCTTWLRLPLGFVSSSSQQQTQQQQSWIAAIDEILRQCLRQEPVSNQDSTTKPPARRDSSIATQRLLEWAQSTAKFDSLVILLECSNLNDAYHVSTIQTLLHWAAEQRALSGLPVSIVLLTSQSHEPAWNTSIAQGSIGWRIQQQALPTSQTTLQTFWQRLYKQHGDDLIWWCLPDDLIQSLTTSFHEQHLSMVQFILQLKSSLAQSLFTQPGSFLLINSKYTKDFNEQEEDEMNDTAKRRLWFLLDPQAKRLLLEQKRKKCDIMTTPAEDLDCWIEQMETHRQRLTVVRQLESCYLQCLQKSKPRQPKDRGIEQPLLLTTSPLLSATKEQTTLSKDVIRELLTVLLRLREEESPLSSLRLFIHQFAIVIDQCLYVSDLLFAFETVYKDFFNCLNQYFDDSNWVQPWSVHVRRQVVAGLVVENTVQQAATPPSTSLYVPGLLYRLMDNYVSIGQDDWFDKFYSAQSETNDVPLAWNWFASGIYSLQALGLIKERRVAGGKTVFDKTVVVWCGIDEYVDL